MKSKKTIRFLVDSDSRSRTMSALSVPGLSELSQKVVEFGGDIVQRNLNDTLDSVLDLLLSLPSENERFSISEVRFSLVFDASGEVSIASLAKGSVAGRTGVEVSIRRKA